MRDVEPIARRASDELEVPVPSPDAAGWVLALLWATEMARGGSMAYRCAAGPVGSVVEPWQPRGDRHARPGDGRMGGRVTGGS